MFSCPSACPRFASSPANCAAAGRRGCGWRASRGALLPLLLCLFLAAAFTLSCNRRPDEPAARSRPNVLLITVDTLRADHLGVYGYPIATSPNIDDFASSGLVFEQAVTTAPETAPAIASILTGRYQYRHGVGYNRATLPDFAPTIAEILSSAGYSTGGVVTNVLVDEKHGFGRGFDDFISLPLSAFGNSQDDRAAALALAWLRRKRLAERAGFEEGGDPGAARAGAALRSGAIRTAAAAADVSPGASGDGNRNGATQRPWFLWIHFVDPHGPYFSAPAWWSETFRYDEKAFGDNPAPEVSATNFGLGVLPRYQANPKL